MILLPDEKQAEIWRDEIADGIARRQPADVRPRLRDPLRPDRAAARRRRRHRRPEGPGPPRPPPVQEGRGVPCLMAVHAGRDRQRARPRARLREGHRRHARRRHRDHLQGRGRDRPLRRAGRALRRDDRARPGRLRDPGRGRLRPAPRLLRVPARAEADRRPDVREGHPGNAPLDLEHGRVRRHDPRPEGDHRRHARGDAEDPRRHPVGGVRSRSGSPRTGPAARTSIACDPRRRANRSSRSAATSGR